jgi:hypothetical protein
MSPDPERDKSAILRRRAFFVGSALTAALTGCPKDPGPQPGVKPTVGVEPEASTELPAPTGVVTVGSAEPGEKMPSLEVPSDVSATARENFTALAAEVPPIHKELDEASAALDGICDIHDASCNDAWLAVAKHFGRIDVQMDNLAPRCPGSSADAKRFEQRLAEHRAYIQKRRRAIEARIAAAAKDSAGEAKWKDHLAAAVVPRPCLDFSCKDW